MRAIVQRVIRATVTVNSEVVGTIGPGLCVLLGVTHSDSTAEAEKMAAKLWHLRIMEDANRVANLSVAETTKSLLVISQFTLYGDTTTGRRPSWIAAAPPDLAEPLITQTVEALRSLGATVQTGRFRTNMQVELVNDGPFTVTLEVANAGI
jgi:D-aminoacyl-tRNA deacylase